MSVPPRTSRPPRPPLASTLFEPPEGAEAVPMDEAAGQSFVARSFAERYALVSQLGEGGMGEVWLLQDRQLDRGVALKTVRSDKRGEGSATQFADEVLLQARLDHPAFVPVHEVGVAPSGEPYFTMRRVEGESLSDALARVEPGDVRGQHRLLRAFAQICAAIHFAHDRGIVHRDLKPANIMLGAYGEVYVLDLGIAQRVSRDEPSAESTLPKRAPIRAGTPGYMAPEQRSAEEAVSDRADVYALGCILFELLVQRPLHDPATLRSGPLVEVYRAADPSPLAAARERPGALPITQELDEACRRALALDPAARTIDAGELHDEVVAFLDGAAIERWREDEATKLSEQAAALVAQTRAGHGANTLERRQRALTTLGRAVSLAPAAEATRETIRSLLHEPPPPDADSVLATRMEAWKQVLATDSIGGIVLALCGWVVCVPLMWWMGIRDVQHVLPPLLLGTLNIVWLLAFLWRKPPRAWALLGMGLLSTAAVVTAGRWLGPFGIAPAVFVAHTSFFAMVPDRRTRNGLLGILMAGALAPLLELLLTGQVANMRIEAGTIIVTPVITDFPPLATWATLLLLNAGVMVGAGLTMRVVFRRMEDAQRTILWHQWQIEALMDVEGSVNDQEPSRPTDGA